MTRTGAMRDVVKLEQRSSSQSSTGEQLWTWTVVAERYAERIPFPGREVWSAKQRSARVPTVFRMRYPKEFTVTPQMRLTHKGRVYDITSAIDEDGREVDLIVYCDELVGEPS